MCLEERADPLFEENQLGFLLPISIKPFAQSLYLKLLNSKLSQGSTLMDGCQGGRKNT
jgi:hypothetical protein